VQIGNNVLFGPGVKLFSESHNFEDPEKFINEQGETRKGVIIEDGVWVGSDVTILDGVTIGANAVIAAKSLVNKDVPSFSIVAGIPAKVIKYRKIDL
jgi:acetyltransferase-like isoleucine patch superfamily enzyme